MSEQEMAKVEMEDWKMAEPARILEMEVSELAAQEAARRSAKKNYRRKSRPNCHP